MGLQEIVVGLVVIAAVAWLVRSFVHALRGGGCTCESAATCPYARNGKCSVQARSDCSSD